jgi:hypothetical protein
MMNIQPLDSQVLEIAQDCLAITEKISSVVQTALEVLQEETPSELHTRIQEISKALLSLGDGIQNQVTAISALYK